MLDMKKIISMIIAATMLMSLFVVSVNAETSSNPVINVHAEKYDGSNPPSNYKPGTYDVYKISYTTSGIDGNFDKMLMLTIKMTISDTSKVAAKSWSAPKTSGSASQKDANGVKSYLLDGDGLPVKPYNMQEGFYNWQNTTEGINAFDWDTYPDGGTQESKPYIETLIYVTKDESVTFTYESALKNGLDSQTEILLVDWKNEDDPTAVRAYNDEISFTINGKAGNVLTLGTPEEESSVIALPSGDVTSEGLTDLNGNAVTSLSTNYAIDRVTTETLDLLNKRYFIVATDTNNVTNEDAGKPFEITFGSGDFDGVLETSGAVSFYAIVKSSTHTIKKIELKVVDK